VNLIRLLLYPFSLLYGLIIGFRNYLYSKGYLKSVSFDFPVIAIGNLSVGGTGKTPHIEYLIKLIGQHYTLATLSRGYKRKSKGYRLAQATDDANTLGDEPFLLHKKYPQAIVAVAEDRLLAIPELINDAPQVQLVLLDDAFQHRSVIAGLSILLTTYNNPYYKDVLLPAGRLREYASAASRADFIVVSKCPFNISKEEKEVIKSNIKPLSNQKVFFSFLKYGLPYNLLQPETKIALNKNTDVYVFCGIANTDELEEYLQENTKNYWIRKFDDHHYYDQYELEVILETFKNIESENKILLTTEKDAARLWEFRAWFIQKKLSIFALPVEVAFFQEDKIIFDQQITNYLQHIIKTP
jgi:tetraacyldisaccharide 4'-kinase